MARSSDMNELKIVFVYDRFSCRREEDDPKDAILYFHPNTLSLDKRIAICGQLMGVSHFFTDIISSPRILTLANGKFALRQFDDQYVLAIGCSSVTSDFLLEKEADILLSVIKFFHCDIKMILRNSNFDRAAVSTKLTTMMNHYIPVSQQHGDLFSLTFGILPILHLPKSANNISLQASVLLQTCLLKIGVLGGIVMYQNKVVGVELGQSLAQKLAFTQPYRMPPADLIPLNFALPVGIQIFRVYISDSELEELQSDCSKFQNPESYGMEPSKPKKVSINPVSSPTPEELSRKGDSSVFSDASSGIHSDETRQECQRPDSIRTVELSKSNHKLTEINPQVKFSHFKDLNGCKPLPRRCQSVIDLYYGTEFGLDSQHQDTTSTAEKASDLKTFGASVPDPTFPYFCPSGRHSISSSLHNSNSGDDDNKQRHEDSSVENSHTDPVSMAKIPLRSAPVTVQRPMDLALPQYKLNGPQRIKKKLWAAFNELLSPMETEPSFDFGMNGDLPSEVKSSNTNPTILYTPEPNYKPAIKVPESIHLRLLNSFRRLSSHEEALEEGGEGDGEYTSSYSATNSICSDTENGHITSPSLWSISHNSSLIASDKVVVCPPRPKPKVKGKATPIRKKESTADIPRNEVALYIYYDGSMRLLLLLDKTAETDQDLIESIWNYVSSSLIQLKVSLSTVEEQSSFSHQSDPYCFLRYESVWKSMAHGGRNESMDFNTVQIMHRDFTRNPHINELIIRGDDHVVYGYQCAGSEVYYQQRAGLQPGLPMPSDLMGKVPLKAKRRLERDHSIFLL